MDSVSPALVTFFIPQGLEVPLFCPLGLRKYDILILNATTKDLSVSENNKINKDALAYQSSTVLQERPLFVNMLNNM